MSIELCSLSSGSSGNCIYVGGENSGLLVDCGISGKEILQNLKDVGICNTKIKGILVTHEHSDHIKSVGIVSRKLNIPIYANVKTWEGMVNSIGNVKSENIRTFTTGADFEIEGIGIKTFNIPHDAAEPVGYCFKIGSSKISIATDLGFFSDTVKDNIKDSQMVMLESNHDIEMLKVSKYPYFLKRRIMSDHGHLSNEAAGVAAYELINAGVREIMLGHLSKENNFPELAFETVKGILEAKNVKIGADVSIELAPRSGISKFFNVI